MPQVANVMPITARKIWATRLCFWTKSNMAAAILRCFRALAACAALGACSHAMVLEHHPLAGKIWDVRAGAFVSQRDLLARLPSAPQVILGETHDNPEHHRLQRVVLDSL